MPYVKRTTRAGKTIEVEFYYTAVLKKVQREKTKLKLLEKSKKELIQKRQRES